jgi:hypothetical protein
MRGIAVVALAGGFALSMSLHPLPAKLPTFDLMPPERSAPRVVTFSDSDLANYRMTGSALQVTDLIRLTEVLGGGLPDLQGTTVLELVNTYGLPDVVKTLELLSSVAIVGESRPNILSGGGGGGSTAGVPPTAMPNLVELIEYLMAALPGIVSQEFLEVIRTIVTSLAEAVGRPPDVGTTVAEQAGFAVGPRTLRSTVEALPPPPPPTAPESHAPSTSPSTPASTPAAVATETTSLPTTTAMTTAPVETPTFTPTQVPVLPETSVIPTVDPTPTENPMTDVEDESATTETVDPREETETETETETEAETETDTETTNDRHPPAQSDEDTDAPGGSDAPGDTGGHASDPADDRPADGE